MAKAQNVRIEDLCTVRSNLLETQLIEEAVRRGEAQFSAGGQVLYLRFPERVRGAGPLRQTLVALAEKARAG